MPKHVVTFDFRPSTFKVIERSRDADLPTSDFHPTSPLLHESVIEHVEMPIVWPSDQTINNLNHPKLFTLNVSG